MADSTVSKFAPEFGSLVNPLVQGALGAYGRPAVDQAATADRPFIAGAIPGLTPQQKGALNWTNTLTTRPIDTTAQRNMVYQGTRPTTRVATGAFDTRAGLRAANPYDELVRKRAMTDFDEQASQASARRAAQQIGTRGLNTKTGLGNAQFGRDMERQRGDLNSQLLQRGFETGRQQYNADQTRALQAAMGNQNASGRDRALSLQGSNQLQALENFERSAMAQNAGALQGMGSMVAGREQAVADYPWNQVNRLRSVLSGTGQQSNAAGAPWWQTAAGLAGTGASILNSTGAFGNNRWLGNLFSSGAGSGAASAGTSLLDGIASGAGFADGGYVDDEDEPRGAFDFQYDDDEEDDPVAEQPDVIDTDYWEVGALPAPDGGGEDGVVYEEGGGADEPVIAEQGGALAPPAPAQGALAPAGLASKLPTSGYTQAQLMAALEAAKPRAAANQGSSSADAIASLLLGIGSAPTRDFGRAVGAGGQAMQATLAARKREDQLAEQARQKAAALEAKTISDQMGKDRDIQGKALTTEYVQSETGKRELAKLDAMAAKGELDRASAERRTALQNASRERASLGSAGIHAAATRDAARIRSEVEKVPDVVRIQRIRDALPEGSPQRAELDEIIKSRATGQYEKEEDKGAVKRYYETVLPETEGAQAGLANVRLARDLNRAGVTGRFAETQAAVGSVLSALGADGKAVQKAQTIEQLRGILERSVLAEQTQQKGTQTEGDAQRIRASVGSITNTQEANDFLLRAAEAQFLRKQERQQFFDAYRDKTGKYTGAEAAWNKSLQETPLIATNPKTGKPMFFNEFVEEAKRLNGGSVPMDAVLRDWRSRAKG